MSSQLTGRKLREFWVLTLGQFLLFCGFTMFFQFPLFIKELGGGEREIGLIMGLAIILPTVLLPWFAAMAGQWDRKRLMVFGAGLVALSTVACTALGAPDALMGAVLSVRGLGFTIYLIANGAYVAGILPAAERARWFSIYFAFWSISSAIGPGVGEYLILNYGFTEFFLASFAIVVVSTGMTFGLTANQPESVKLALNPFRAAIFFLVELTRKRFRSLFFTLLFMAGGFSAVLTFSATYLRTVGLSSGLFFAAYAVVAVAARFGGGGLSDRYGRAAVAIPMLMTLVVGLLVYSFTDGVPLVLVSALLLGLGWGLANPTISAQMIDVAPVGLQHVAVGGFQFAFNVGMLVTTPIYGFVADNQGYPAMWRLASGMLLVAVAIYALFVRPGKPLQPA